MPTLHLTLSAKLWHWHWDSPEDAVLGVPGAAVLNSEIVHWLDANGIRYSTAQGDDLEPYNNVLDVTFEKEADAIAFKEAWLTN